MTDHNDFEREAALGMPAESMVRPGQRRPRPMTAILLLCGATGALGIAAYYSFIRTPVPLPQPEETFNTARNQPGLVFDAPAPKADNRLILSPPPPPAPHPLVSPAPTIAAEPMPAAPPPPAAVDEDAIRRLKEAREERLKRLNSEQMIVTGGVGTMAASPAALPASTGGDSEQYHEEDANRRFASSIGSQAVQTVQAVRNARTDAFIPAGAFIHGVLETAIQSDLPGMVRAVISEDTWSFDGRRILLPKGSMLIGTYRSGLSRGQTRLLLIWTRALRADGTSVDLASYGTDDLGRSGLAGEVDSHDLERFGSAALLSIIGGTSSFIAGLNLKGNSQNSRGGNNQISQEGTSQAQQTISQTISDMANTALKNSIDIPPTINVDQGTRILIFVQRDLDFSALYPDPVEEALNELRHAKATRPGQAGNVGDAGHLSSAGCCANSRMVAKP